MHTYNKTGRRKTWETKNLGPLRDILENHYGGEIPLPDLAIHTGRSVQDLSNKFRADDMKISCAEEIAYSLGYKLTLLFPQKTYLPGMELPKPRYNFNTNNRLNGLVKYMNDSNVTIHSIAKRTGLNANGLSIALQKGDMHIKDLNRILREMNIDVIWDFHPAEKTA